jgi:hypothetical protein
MSLNPQMDILYLKDQGHVLGIFTRAAEPVKIETDATPFVGDGLHLRGLVPGQDLVVPPNLIGIFRADRNWRQILQPNTLYITVPPAPALALASFAAVAPGVVHGASSLTITWTTASAANILVLVLDTKGGAPVQFGTVLTAPQISATLSITGLIAGDTYNALVFVPTYPMAIANFIAP